MQTTIAPAVLPTQLLDLHTAAVTKPKSAVGFESLMVQALGATTDLQVQSQRAVEDNLLGKDVTQVEVLSAVKKADLALRLMLQVRNKVLEAYNEIQQIRM